jgi:hypothetical protein
MAAYERRWAGQVHQAHVSLAAAAPPTGRRLLDKVLSTTAAGWN